MTGKVFVLSGGGDYQAGGLGYQTVEISWSGGFRGSQPNGG